MKHISALLHESCQMTESHSPINQELPWTNGVEVNCPPERNHTTKTQVKSLVDLFHQLLLLCDYSILFFLCCLCWFCCCWLYLLHFIFLHWSCLGEIVIATLLLEQLGEVGLAVKKSIKCSIGWWGEEASPMCTPKAWFVVKLTFHSQLFQWIYSFLAWWTFFLSPREEGREFARCPSQFVWRLSSWLVFLGIGASFLEKLFKVRLAVQNSFHGWVVAHC